MPAESPLPAETAVPRREQLNNVDHADLRVITGHSAAFGDSVNQAVVFPTEFEALTREYPIFFRRDDSGGHVSVVLLGLDRDENLLLDESGWQARYIPAMHQRGPFVIAMHRPRDELVQPDATLQIEVEHPRVSNTEGEPLFLPHGGNAPYLEHMLGVMRTILIGRDKSAPMFAAFEELTLLREVNLDIQLDSSRSYSVPGLLTIDERRLGELDGPALDLLHRQGFLRSAFQVAASTANVGRLIELKNRKDRAR